MFQMIDKLLTIFFDECCRAPGPWWAWLGWLLLDTDIKPLFSHKIIPRDNSILPPFSLTSAVAQVFDGPGGARLRLRLPCAPPALPGAGGSGQSSCGCRGCVLNSTIIKQYYHYPRPWPHLRTLPPLIEELVLLRRRQRSCAC